LVAWASIVPVAIAAAGATALCARDAAEAAFGAEADDTREAGEE